jgi:uncharacterized protein YpmS
MWGFGRGPLGLCLCIQQLAVIRRQQVLHLHQENEIAEICMHIGTDTSNLSDLINPFIERYQQEQATSRLSKYGNATHFGRCSYEICGKRIYVSFWRAVLI